MCDCKKNTIDHKNVSKKLIKSISDKNANANNPVNISVKIPWTPKYIKDCITNNRFYFYVKINNKIKKVCIKIANPITTQEQLHNLIQNTVQEYIREYRKKLFLMKKIILILNDNKEKICVPKFVDTQEKFLLYYNIIVEQKKKDFQIKSRVWNGNLTELQYFEYLRTQFYKYLIENKQTGSCILECSQ